MKNKIIMHSGLAADHLIVNPRGKKVLKRTETLSNLMNTICWTHISRIPTVTVFRLSSRLQFVIWTCYCCGKGEGCKIGLKYNEVIAKMFNLIPFISSYKYKQSFSRFYSTTDECNFVTLHHGHAKSYRYVEKNIQ